MNWLNKDTVSCKQEFFSDDAVRSLFSKESLLSNVSDALYPALLPPPKVAVTEEKGELKMSLIQLLFLLIFLFYSFLDVFP